ncbi:citrate synthase [Akkermansiaceae bacterium]|nr:citrate synthase [bacterium]MDB4294315.1 citrate synthase [Akkermansiaceae bacterium]MDB4820678.1 citrate synthase [Akkermansiaceae bacterium]MDC1207064.1 citrate synthase [Akkermansiaceae bacterium]MDC1405761.1 citrate synthase [Akkermansiaceae bacterium]
MSDYAKGLEGVIANESALSNVEGLEGRLSYLGYDIAELVENCSFEEVTHLLHRGKLPTTDELSSFEDELRHDREIPQGVIDFLKAAPKDANPMDVLRTGVSMLGLYDKRAKVGDPDQEANRHVALSLVAQTPVIVAYFHRARQGLDLPPVRSDLSEAAHFLYLITGEEPSPAAVKTLDVAYTIHADHGMNASTFSARVTVATLSDFYSAMTSAIGTLKGPLHGGANEGVIKMLKKIGSLDKVDAFVEDCLANKKKIMGIGHRVYKVLDPRAPHLQKMAIKLTEELGESKWIDMSERIATLMREKKGLNANVDFYSATVYYSLGIPTDLFTPIFAISRMAGWSAQVLEQLEDSRLYRPLTKYVGPTTLSKVTPIEER